MEYEGIASPHDISFLIILGINMLAKNGIQSTMREPRPFEPIFS